MHLDFSAAFTERTPRVARAAKLHRAAARKKEHAFLAEGFNAVEAATVAGVVKDVFVTKSAAGRFPGLINQALRAGAYVHPVTDRAAKDLAGTVTPTGIVAVCAPVVVSANEIISARPQCIAVGIQTNDPGNAGTLIRSADALGAGGVIFAGAAVDPQGDKAVRASAGSLFHVPVARAHDAAVVIDELKAAAYTVLATAADGECQLGDDSLDLKAPVAWLFGNEAHGLDDRILRMADGRVAIPIEGSAESFNLATAAALCLWETSRARRA